VKTTIKPHGLDIGGTCVGPPAEGGGWMWDAVKAQIEGLGGLIILRFESASRLEYQD
jgi:hypothetical protein